MLILALLAARSTSMNDTPAWSSFFLMNAFSSRSSAIEVFAASRDGSTPGGVAQLLTVAAPVADQAWSRVR